MSQTCSTIYDPTCLPESRTKCFSNLFSPSLKSEKANKRNKRSLARKKDEDVSELTSNVNLNKNTLTSSLPSSFYATLTFYRHLTSETNTSEKNTKSVKFQFPILIVSGKRWFISYYYLICYRFIIVNLSVNVILQWESEIKLNTKKNNYNVITSDRHSMYFVLKNNSF